VLRWISSDFPQRHTQTDTPACNRTRNGRRDAKIIHYSSQKCYYFVAKCILLLLLLWVQENIKAHYTKNEGNKEHAKLAAVTALRQNGANEVYVAKGLFLKSIKQVN